MPLLTEEALRAMRLPSERRELLVEPGTVCSPSALDYLAARGITLVFREGALRRAPGAAAGPKPEHLTHLRGEELVPKSHPVIAFRGEMDALFAVIAEAGAVCALSSYSGLRGELSELLTFARSVLLSEVTGEAFTQTELLGRPLDEYREMSHNPQKHFGLDHPTPSLGMGSAALRLNTIRTQTRRAELAAARAFLGDGEPPLRGDIIMALNRLSSVVYVLFCRELGEDCSPD
jgi:ethanolamine utilization cobalamin adenosyltransferase